MRSIPINIIMEELNKIPLGRIMCDQCGEWDHDCICVPSIIERTKMDIISNFRSHISEGCDDPMKDIRKKLNLIGENLFDDEFLEYKGIEKSDCGDFILLNYSQISKPNSLNRLCRGTVFTRDGRLMCLPFIRFFNLHETGADNVDWRHCNVLEKMDGSLVNVWNDGYEWHVSTRRMVDDLFMSQFGGGEPFNMMDYVSEYLPDPNWKLDPNYWYVFEAVTPKNRIVTDYDENEYGLYLLTIRNKVSLNELGWSKIEKIHRNLKEPMVRLPREFPFNDYGEISKMFDSQPSDFEGVVVVDKDRKRIKIKQKSYVHLHHIISNISSKRNMIDLILGGEESEVLAYFPDLEKDFEDLKRKMNELKSDISVQFAMHNHLESQKDFALAVKDLPYSHFLFRMRKGEDLNYIFNQLTGKKLERFLF